MSNGAQLLAGHLNYQSRTLDGGLRVPSPGFDLSQYGNNVMVTSADLVQQLDTASVALANETSVTGVTYAHGDDTVLFADEEEGKVWATSLEGVGGFNPQADPAAEDLDAPRVAVGVGGDAFVVTADGVVRSVTGFGEQAVLEEAGSLGAELSDAASLTEEITDLPHGDHVSDEVYARAAAAFTERELGQVIAMAMVINAWNRIGVTTRLHPPHRH